MSFLAGFLTGVILTFIVMVYAGVKYHQNQCEECGYYKACGVDMKKQEGA